MIKKWTVCLSIIILVLNFVPNLLQGHQVFAENQKNYKIKLSLLMMNHSISHIVCKL